MRPVKRSMAAPLTTAAPLIPPHPTLKTLRDATAGCRACPLWKTGTQTVFGAGRRKARLMFVGEQPGDHEDRTGQPFVGPAGKLLDRALAEAGIERKKVWVTNAVKHFKWKPQGKRRLHQKPSAGEVAACRPWLEAELRRVAPNVLILLGATAAKSLLVSAIRVTVDRGIYPAPALTPVVIVTTHPSSLLRMPESKGRQEAYETFVADLALSNRP